MSPVSCGMPSKCMIACQAPLLVSRDSSTDDFDSVIDVNKSAEYRTRVQSITLVLPLTATDLTRAELLFGTLSGIPSGHVHEMYVIVPDSQVSEIASSISAKVNAQFPVRVISELTLFDFHDRDILSDAYGYAIQMALKLLVSKIVKTEFYLTLDADLILLEPKKLASILLNQINRSENSAKECSADNTSNCATNINAAANLRAIYEDESRSVHNNWWSGSSSLSGLFDCSNNGTRMHFCLQYIALKKMQAQALA